MYDTGLDGHGRPWIAMEHVEGVPVDAWCRERRASVAERLALLMQVLGEAGAFVCGDRDFASLRADAAPSL